VPSSWHFCVQHLQLNNLPILGDHPHLVLSLATEPAVHVLTARPVPLRHHLLHALVGEIVLGPQVRGHLGGGQGLRFGGPVLGGHGEKLPQLLLDPGAGFRAGRGGDVVPHVQHLVPSLPLVL
jgi:hypothetical protein